nr:ubiquitin-like-specific protease ESD4 [Ipomoea batatas]
MEEVGKKESRVQIHEIIEDSPSPEEQQFPGQDETVSAVVAMKPRIDDENTSSEQIQKLLDETTRLVEEGSKLRRSISEFLDVALPRSKEAATTPELSALLNMLKVQSKGGYVTALEMTQCLLEALKNYEVELTIKKEVDVSSDDSQPTKKSNNNEGRLPETFKGIDYDKVVELFFTPKKFEGLVVVKLGEAIEVINSYEFILRERAGSEPKCWYLPTYICQETQANYSVKMYERNFKPYVINNSSCDIIYLPLFLNSHWYLVKANTKSRKAFILDSSVTYNQIKSRLDEAKKIVGVLHNLLKEHTRRDPTYQYEANFNDWKYETASGVPQQGNGVDCGAFVMLFMEMDMDDQLKKHTGFNIDMERRRIALELLYHPRNARLSLVLENL